MYLQFKKIIIHTIEYYFEALNLLPFSMILFRKKGKSAYSVFNPGCEAIQGWKFMSYSHCQELGQQASWLLIGCTRVNNQSEARSAS